MSVVKMYVITSLDPVIEAPTTHETMTTKKRKLGSHINDTCNFCIRNVCKPDKFEVKMDTNVFQLKTDTNCTVSVNLLSDSLRFLFMTDRTKLGLLCVMRGSSVYHACKEWILKLFN